MDFQIFRQEMWPLVWKWHVMPEMRNFFRGVHTEAGVRDLIQRAIVLVGVLDGKPIGAISLANSSPILRIYKLGVAVDPAYHKRGYGRELCKAAVRFAFDTMHAHKVVIEALSTEPWVGEKYGFKLEGVSRKSVYLNGNYYDENVYGILYDEYERLKEELWR